MISSRHLPTVLLALAGGALSAGGLRTLDAYKLESLSAQERERRDFALSNLQAQASALGLSAETQFQTDQVLTDAFGETHVRVQQLQQGLKVWGGTAVLHLDADGGFSLTNNLLSGIRLNPNPSLGPQEALGSALRDFAAKQLSQPPVADLIVFPEVVTEPRADLANGLAPSATDMVHVVTGYKLAYHTRLSARLQDDTRSTDYIVDAHTGAILKKWQSLETAAVTGTGSSLYSGSVSLSTNSLSSGYEMRDTLRGTSGTTVTDMANGTSGNGTIYTDADDAWGDGGNFVDGSSGSTTSATGQTAGVDALFGFENTWDYFKNVLGRNGIDGSGTATSLRVHYSNAYDNAFWDDACFCMTFGDGSSFQNLTAMDVIGHELSHGVCSDTANLTYSGESGGLNESDSDINGTFVTYYGYNGGTGSTVPNTIPSANLHGYTPWTIGSQLSNPPLRYMYKPSLDGTSPDAWYSGIGNLNVHYSSGPNNRAIYFLAQGATTTGNTSSTYLPGGMTGIGNDKAARIWFRALSVYMTPSTDYAGARLACIKAATDLYGSLSTEYVAVQNAYHGINVGQAGDGSTTEDITAPTVTGLAYDRTSGTITVTSIPSDNVGVVKVEYYIDGSLVGTSTTGSSYSVSFDSTGFASGNHTLLAKAYDANGNTGTQSVALSIDNPVSQSLLNPGFEAGATVWTETSGVIYQASGLAHSGNWEGYLDGYGATHIDTLSQDVAIPPGTNASLTFWLRISTAETDGTVHDTLKIQIRNTSNTVLATLASYSNLDSGTYRLVSFPLGSAYSGTTIRIYLEGKEDASKATSFLVDDFSLKVVNPDLDGSGSVDGIDLGLLAQDYGTTNPEFDLDSSGSIDDADVTILLNAFGR